MVKYLRGIQDKGCILNLSQDPTIDCYADVDFAVAWTLQASSNLSSVKSRSGYIILFAEQKEVYYYDTTAWSYY